MIAAALGAGGSQSWIAAVAHAATGGLIAAVWQGVLLSLAVALALRLLPKTPAAVRFAIWFAVFVVVAALPLAALLHGGGVAANGPSRPWLTLDERWCAVLAASWGVASLVRVATLLLAALRVRALWKRAAPFEFARVGEVRDSRLGERVGSRQAQLCISNDVDRPAVIGFFSPKILIPAWLVEKLTAAELEQIVLHEAGHLSRADDWMNLLQKIALVVFPLNPALAWVERRLCFERELACDERVLATTCAPKAYAACLASLAEHRLGRRGLALALGALGRESELGRRVRRILRRGERMQPIQAKLVLGGAMLGLMAASVGLERCPAVIGFAPPADGVAVMSEPAATNDGIRDAFRYQPVVFHLLAVPWQPNAKAARGAERTRRTAKSSAASTGADNTLSRASLAEPANRYDRTSATGAGYSQVVSSYADSGRKVSDSDAMVESAGTQAEVRRLVQWVVMTSWRGDDGSRMTLTTVRETIPSSPAGMVRDGSGVTNAVPVEDQVHPYAAVPVRGGWLVIEL